jgi:hypothetical protein
MSHKKFLIPCVGLVLIVLMCSCSGPPRVEVTGTVSFPDGTPLTTGNVRGISEEGTEITQIRGRLGADGSFSLFEVSPGDRVPAGKTYTIWIANAAEYPQHQTEQGSAPDLPPIPLIGARLSSPNTTDLRLEVPNSREPVIFDITVQRP